MRLRVQVVFDNKTETCVYDKSHDAALIPDDVVAINGFGEASLLKARLDLTYSAP